MIKSCNQMLHFRSKYSVLSFPIAALAIATTVAAPASAALIMDSVRYDGHVRSGSTLGIEKHSTNTDVAPFAPAVNLTTDNSQLPMPPFSAGNLLNTTLDEVNDTFNGNPVVRSIVTITAPGAGNIFANTLDSNTASCGTLMCIPNPSNPAQQITLPVEFEAFFISNSLPAGQKINVVNLGFENFDLPPFPHPEFSQITGAGTAANPLHVVVKLPASEVNDFRNGFLKVHLYWNTQPIPEPSTCAMMLLGIFGIIGYAARRRQG